MDTKTTQLEKNTANASSYQIGRELIAAVRSIIAIRNMLIRMIKSVEKDFFSLKLTPYDQNVPHRLSRLLPANFAEGVFWQLNYPNPNILNKF